MKFTLLVTALVFSRMSYTRALGASDAAGEGPI